MIVKDERQQCIKFQDAIGEIVDAHLKEGMHPDRIREVLKDEADQVHGRSKDLKAEQ